MRRNVLLLAALLVSGTRPHVAGAEPPLASFASRAVPPGPLGAVLEPVRALAAERLGTGPCRTLFELVRDFTGRPAARRLELAERSPSSHFARIMFEATESGRCAEDGVV